MSAVERKKNWGVCRQEDAAWSYVYTVSADAFEVSLRAAMPSIRNTYLIVYNLIQALGWTWIGAKLIPHCCRALAPDPPTYEPSAFADVGAILWPLQLAAYLEVLHNIVGLVRGNFAVTMLQAGYSLKKHKSGFMFLSCKTAQN